jgi:hypothetical protein
MTAARPFETFRAILLGLVLAFCLTSCAPNATVPVADYPKQLVGDWQGTVGETRETIRFSADGTYVADLRQTGFISNTLGQGVTGTIRGTWTIADRVVTLKIDSADQERVVNRTTTGTIESFKQSELVVRSSIGTVSTFVRAL